jgi:hypothetical protein
VTTRQEFDTAVASGRWDLVLVDAGDAVSFNPPRTRNAPVVLPVVFNPTREELQAAKKQHAHVLKAPIKNYAFIDAIDGVLAARASTLKAEDKPGR